MNISTESIAEQVRETFPFSINKFPLSGPDKLSTPWYGLFRSDTGEVVGNGSVTSRYTPHTTEDVLALTDAASEAFDNDVASATCHFRDGHYVNIAPNADIRRSIFGTSDNIFPRIMVRAAYDGKAFCAQMGYYRDLCDNLSMLRQVSGTSVSIRHTSGLRSHMDNLIHTFRTLKESWSTLEGVIAQLENQSVQIIDFLDAVYPQPEEGAAQRAVTIHRNRTEEIFRRMTNERYRSQRGKIDGSYNVSAWEAYNAVQGYVQHAASRKRSFNNDFDRILLANNDAAVRKAEALALATIAA